MPNIAIYNEAGTPKNVIQYLLSVDETSYLNRTDVLIHPDVSEVAGLPLKHWKVVGSALQAMTQAERDAVDAAELADDIAEAKAAAKSLYEAMDRIGRSIRALGKLTVDEINILRARDRDRSLDVAAASSLANLKTLWAARSSLADRSYAQAKTAFDAIVDGE